MRTRLVKPLSVLVAGAGLLMVMPGAAQAAPPGTKQITITRGATDPSKIQITWASVVGASRYNVSVFDGTNDNVQIVPAPTNTFALTRAEPCVRLRVNIGSRDSSGAGATSHNVWLNSLAPGGVSRLVAERTGNFAQLTATWRPPAWLGYGQPGGYKIQLVRATDKAVVYEGVVPTTLAQVDGLDPALSYVLHVTAVNSYGSCYTAKQSIGSSRPTAPTSVKAVRDPASPAQVNLSWAAPAYGGYAAAAYYEVGHGVDKVTQWTRVDATATSLQLDPGTTWTVQVRAVNQYGHGTPAGVKLKPAGAVGTPTSRPEVTVTPVGSKIQVKLTSKIGAFTEYPKLVMRINPTVATTGGGFSDEHWGQNGATTVNFGDLPNGLYTVQVNGANAAGEIEWARQIINIGNVGALDTQDWMTVASGGNGNGDGEGRNGNGQEVTAITKTPRTSGNQALMTSVTLKDGAGYGIWSRASLDGSRKMNGYLVEFDPNYSKIVKNFGPAMVLRLQHQGKMCDTPLATTKMSAALTSAGTHRVAVVANGDSLYATVDNVVVLNVASLTNAAAACKSPTPTGTQAGVQGLNSAGLSTYTTTTLN